jgi:cell division protein FtsL
MKNKLVLYTSIYLITSIFALSSLYFNAQTVPLIKKTTELTKQNSELKLENQRLRNKISIQKSLKNIHLKAKKFNMILQNPNKVTHIKYTKTP